MAGGNHPADVMNAAADHATHARPAQSALRTALAGLIGNVLEGEETNQRSLDD
jgi:hypothetical protein